MFEKAKLFVKKVQLDNKQRKLNSLYKRDGLTEEVVDKQVEINTMRHELDLPDSSNFIFEEYVQ